MKNTLMSRLSILLLLLCCGSFSFLQGQDILQADPRSRLQEIYESECRNTSDINEHLPVLRQLANECSSVVEIGVRTIVSTWGIILGISENSYLEKTYVGIDLEYPPSDRLQLIKQLAVDNGVDFTFWRINDMHIAIEPTDLLFIDSLHTYCHLTYELETLSPNVSKYICMPGTSEPWGDRDDSEYHGNYAEYPSWYNKTKRGLWPAVADFLKRHPEWSLFERRTNNHGFTILKRNDENEVKKAVYHPDLENVLKNKIILCTGPSLNQYNLLKRTTEADMNVIPFKKIFLTTNDPRIMDITFNGKKPVCELIADRGKQLDCLNCIITTMKNAVNDPEVNDDDIILFKHETVYLSDMGLVKKAVSKILEGYDMVARSWIVPKSRTRGTDAFFVRVGAVRDIVKDFPVVTQFTEHDTFCEEYFTSHIVYKIANVYDVPFFHSNGWFNELGFYHIPSAEESQRAPWDKKNYDDLFK